jgi:two-component system, chemotaxis family, sensor kinase Cph1
MIQTPAIASSAMNGIPSPEEEPIRIPGFIKPYGVLLALEEPQLEIVQISNNTQELLGTPPKELLNQPLATLLGKRQANELKQSLKGEFSRINPLRISIKQSVKTLFFDGIIHRYDGVVILELLPTPSKTPSTFFNFYHLVKTATDRIQEATTTAELGEIAVQEFRDLTGFDRIMVYKFDNDGAGTVIAEVKGEGVKDSYLGLRYPATDIPEEARQLFFLNKVRVIPDVNDQRVAIVPAHHPKTDRPLDLSLSILRGVSPSHIEYLQNMGVIGSLVIALTKRKALWGLISCHHYSPKSVSYELQTACEFLGQVMSLELVSQEENDDLDYKVKLNTAQSRLLESIAIAHTLQDGLVQSCPQLLDLVGARGCAICINGAITVMGETPSLEDLQGLVQWLEREAKDNIFSTDCLGNRYPAAERFKDVASGLLVLTLSKVQKNYLLWFRPEVIQTVTWAGNPEDSYQVNETGVRELCPRQSFELWKETVRSKSQPWLTVELEAAREFRSALVGLILRQADELAKMNVELVRSNTELDAFAYISSHDLKEPLRGIHNYANFLMEDYGEVLDEGGVAKLQTLVRLTQRMENLINSLLHYSRLGRTELSRKPTDLNELVQQAIATLKMSLSRASVDFRLPRPLPIANCDRIQVSELFTNLISNAIKYSDNSEQWVEIGFIESEIGKRDPSIPYSPYPIFYVRDNGIGIPEQHQDKIFQIFRRLHAQDDYGGGSGAGLTIAKKIVEHHGGEIWVSSKPAEGSTFYFTLPEEEKE